MNASVRKFDTGATREAKLRPKPDHVSGFLVQALVIPPAILGWCNSCFRGR